MANGFSIEVRVRVPASELGSALAWKEAFFDRLWSVFGSEGMTGIHEGSVLATSKGVQERGVALLDGATAPEDRDWVGNHRQIRAVLFFSDRQGAQKAKHWFMKNDRRVAVGKPTLIEDQDWNAQWRAKFKGVAIGRRWRIDPPWLAKSGKTKSQILINPGAGFGTGTHETTYLCLDEIIAFAGLRDARLTRRRIGEGFSALDFGSGSGVLAFALAKCGARSVTGVEIDALALDNAKENAALNGLEKRVRFKRTLPGGRFDVIVANILRPVLVEHAQALVSRLKMNGVLILSGLLVKDVASVRAAYSARLGDRWHSRVRRRGEWRAIVWERDRDIE